MPPVPPPLASFAGLRSRALVLPSFLFFFVLSCILPFGCLLSVLLGGAEQQLMRTRDALLCNQVARTNQSIFSVLKPLITEFPAGAFFLFFGTLTSAFYYHYAYQVRQDLVAIKCSLHFFLNRMHVPFRCAPTTLTNNARR